jgi:hypothetical protein
MNKLQTIDEHIIIRETSGYSLIEKVDVIDVPEVIEFLRVVHNYLKMERLIKTHK